MSTEKNPRRVADNEAMAISRMLRTSPQKLNLVAGLIRGKKVEKALADLTFSKRRIAGDGELSLCTVAAVRGGKGIVSRHHPQRAGGGGRYVAIAVRQRQPLLAFTIA